MKRTKYAIIIIKLLQILIFELELFESQIRWPALRKISRTTLGFLFAQDYLQGLSFDPKSGRRGDIWARQGTNSLP
jgi:hypothetical protein